MEPKVSFLAGTHVSPGEGFRQSTRGISGEILSSPDETSQERKAASLKTITEKTSLADLGALVCEALREKGLDAFLSGGAVVSIYTNNRYESYDLDFVSLADRSKIKKVMLDLGFTQDRGRHFVHPNSKFYVEFPGSAVRVGESLIEDFNELQRPTGTLKLLTPTDCVKDRLAAFYHWNDRQGLDQAIWVCQAQPVKIADVEKWSRIEGEMKKFEEFKAALKAASAKK